MICICLSRNPDDGDYHDEDEDFDIEPENPQDKINKAPDTGAHFHTPLNINILKSLPVEDQRAAKREGPHKPSKPNDSAK